MTSISELTMRPEDAARFAPGSRIEVWSLPALNAWWWPLDWIRYIVRQEWRFEGKDVPRWTWRRFAWEKRIGFDRPKKSVSYYTVLWIEHGVIDIVEPYEPPDEPWWVRLFRY